MELKRITVVIASEKAPSYRLRLASLVPFARREGLELVTVVLPRRPEWLRVWRLAWAFRSSEILIFSKLKLLLGEDFLVRRWCPKWVLDVDDAVMYGKPKRHGQPPNQAWWRRRRFARMVRACSLVVTASETLKRMITPMGQRILVWPTPVDLRRYPSQLQAEESEIKLAWIGLGKNLRYLEDLAEVLRNLASRFSFRLRVISNKLPTLSGVPMELVPWDAHKEGEQLARCHIGLAPLSDDLWTRGKGGYRCIQYAAAGLPCVASPVGANSEVVVPGETGFLAKNPQQWSAALEVLLRDAERRKRLGVQARKRAEALYDLALLAPRYVRWLTVLANSPSRGGGVPLGVNDEEGRATIGEPLNNETLAGGDQ